MEQNSFCSILNKGTNKNKLSGAPTNWIELSLVVLVTLVVEWLEIWSLGILSDANGESNHLNSFPYFFLFHFLHWETILLLFFVFNFD